MKKSIFIITYYLALAASPVFSQCPACTERQKNLVVNGDFESGNTAFTSSYQYFTRMSIPSGGDFGINTNASLWEPSYTCPADHSGSGNMMIVNGVGDGVVTAWQQTVKNVEPSQEYYFAYWLANISQGSRPEIQLEINDVLQGSKLTLATQIGVWKQYFITWNSGNATEAKLRIVNTANNISNGFGNNFAIDDITFFTCNPVKNPPKPALGKDLLLCNIGTLTLDAGSGFDTYAWDDASKTRTRKVSREGQFIVNTTYKGCKAADTVLVKQLPKPDADLGPDIEACADSVSIDAGNHSSYLWNTGETVRKINVQNSGIYTVIVSNGSCTDTASVAATINKPFTVFIGKDTGICEGQKHRISTGIAGDSYQWNTGAETASIDISTAGNYSVTVTKGLCSAADTMNLSVISKPVASLGPDTVMCKQLYALSTGCNTCMHYWNTGETSDTIRVFMSGTYKVKTVRNGCENTDSVLLRFIDQPKVYLGKDITACDTIIVLDAGNPGNIYLWNTGDTTQKITVKKSGLYRVSVGLKACHDEGSLNFTNYDPPQLDIGRDTALCEGESYTFVLPDAPAGYTYQWDNGSSNTRRTVNSSATYSVKLSNSVCRVYDSAAVTVYQKPDVELGPDTIICRGDSLVLAAGKTGNRFKWSTGDTSLALVIKEAGYYTVAVSTYRCTSADDIVVTVAPKPVIPLQDHYGICLEKQAFITLDPHDGRSYYWRPENISAEKINVSLPGVVLCYYTDSNRCTSRKTISISERCNPYIWVPDAFSPDGKFNNNTFLPTGRYIDDYVLEIYNRWGEKVFRTTDLNTGWDGTYKNEMCPDGVFTWKISYSGQGESSYLVHENLSGTVTLFR